MVAHLYPLAWFAPLALAGACLGIALGAQARAAPVAAAPDDIAVVLIDPPAQQAQPGDVVTASIIISQVGGLYGADVRLQYDPAILAVIDAYPGQGGVQILPGPLLTSQGSYNVFINQVATATGYITYASFMLNPALPITGTGVLAYVPFTTLAPGVSALGFVHVELSTRTGQAVPYTTQAGSISVAAPPACPDLNFEPDETVAFAWPISAGEVHTRALCSADDRDWAALQVEPGTVVRIATAPLAPGVDTRLDLFAGDGAMVLASSDGGFAGSVVTATLGQGAHFIGVANGLAGTTGPTQAYRLSVNLLQPPRSTLRLPDTRRERVSNW